MTKGRKELCLIGASGHGKVVAEIAELLDYEILGFMDAKPSGPQLLGYPVFHSMSEEMRRIASDEEERNVVISIGTNISRKRVAEHYSHFNYPILQHPSATISRRSEIGKGTVVMPGVSLNCDVRVGKYCILNTNASIDHDCTIADYVHISPNVALAGNVTIGEGTHVGIGACVIQGVRIGKWCTIGAGAVIIRDVPDGATVVGSPGRVIKQDVLV